jgi:Proton-conducting membrane transporter
LIAFSYLIYNSVIQKTFNNLVNINNYFSIISILLNTIKFKTFNFYNLKLVPEFFLKSNNSLFIKLIKEIKKGLIDADIKFISELKGQFYSNPLISLSLSICLFSMAGIPPLIGFFSKQFVLYSAVQSGYIFISIVAILVSVISASYYLKIIKVLLDMNENNNITIKNTNTSLEKAKIKQYLLKNPSFSINNLRKYLLVKYANITNKKDNLDLIHTNYFKEMQLIFILIFIFKFDLMYKNINKSNSSNNLNYYTKDFYINKELWQLNTSNSNSLPLMYLNKNNEIDISYYNNNNFNYNNNKPKFNNKLKSDLLYQLSNFHSFLISNLTLIILLFIFKPAKCSGNTLLWVKLPNSGNTLKLLILNYIWKNISGWTNYSCKVISYKIFEKIMGYRGSKSEFNINL